MLLTAPRSPEGHSVLSLPPEQIEILPQPTQPESIVRPQVVEPRLWDEASRHPAVTRIETGQSYRAQLLREHWAPQISTPEQDESTVTAVAPYIGPMALLAAATAVSDNEWAERLAENRRRFHSPFLSTEARRAAWSAIPPHLR